LQPCHCTARAAGRTRRQKLSQGSATGPPRAAPASLHAVDARAARNDARHTERHTAAVDEMTTTRQFRCEDLFRFNNVNLDPLTETYQMSFYLQYLSTWPDFFQAEAHPSGNLMGYVMGKAEGERELWHGHVTAVTVAPEFRRRGLGRKLMNSLESTSEHVFDAYFVDLFVRVSNALAIGMYEAFGYSVYRRVLGYYSGTEDAFDMRKALPRDKEKKSVVPLQHPVLPEDLEW
jgi:N-terminal acetyltransferase B complex catalytic subunit